MRLIDADFLKEWADEYLSVFKKYDKGTIKGFVDHAPTIEAVPKDFHDKTCEAMAKRHTEEIQRLMPKQGKWKHGDMGVGYYEYPCCSKCGYETEEETNFCPNCGADMRGENNETDKEMR